jgi:phosphoglycerate kinase
MKLPKVTDIDVKEKRVLLRLDLDVPETSFSRMEAVSETLDYLKGENSQIVVIGHKGRPEGRVDEGLSTKSLQPFFDKWGAIVEENLRFDPGEESNDPEFAKKIASLGDVYVNDAFATSHREHASIVGLPKLLPSAFGFRFANEVENISKVFEDAKKPVLVILSGVKKDKVEMAKKLSGIYDKVLVGGRLPEFFGDEALESVRLQSPDSKLIIGNLNMDKEDVTLHTIDRFKSEISKAGTIVLAGVLGRYEDEGHRQGTREVFRAVADSSAYKIAGGGDTEAALAIFELTEKFDWISVGGGAMVEFLINKTLPGIEAQPRVED